MRVDWSSYSTEEAWRSDWILYCAWGEPLPLMGSAKWIFSQCCCCKLSFSLSLPPSFFLSVSISLSLCLVSLSLPRHTLHPSVCPKKGRLCSFAYATACQAHDWCDFSLIMDAIFCPLCNPHLFSAETGRRGILEKGQCALPLPSSAFTNS